MAKNKSATGLIALKQIIETTSGFTGKEFFQALVRNLAEILDVHGVWVTEFWPEQRKLNALAFWLEGKQVDKYEYLVTNTPCEPVLESHDICHIEENVIDLYPDDPDLESLGAVSYMGISLRDVDGSVIGHLALLDNKRMPEIPEAFAIFKIFAARAAAELRRETVQRRIVEREAKLDRLVNGTSDAIIEFDTDLKVTQLNEAAMTTFGVDRSRVGELELKQLFDDPSFRKLATIVPQHEALSNEFGSLHISEPLICVDSDNGRIPVETSLSCYSFDGETLYALYARNITEKLEDKYRINRLGVEATMLKEQVNERQFDYLIGENGLIKNCIELVNQVAPTDANVLILGETGTGKELFAKAVHDASTRADRSMITLNCAVLPSELIESELFGHVKGAFTGATDAREGRFALADKGTLFLDEIAELPIQLQAKLLRVIQEGTFEPVGSSETRTVDVRLVAATHQDLRKRVEEGRFREDLFYRLNVFPINVPPLRQRENDVALLATAFFEKLKKNHAINVAPLSKTDLNKLSSYHWPGNVRELQNIIERGIITSTDGRFNSDVMLGSQRKRTAKIDRTGSIMTFSEMKELEKQNIIKALNITGWKISGDGGAAELLQIPRTTLASKIKNLGIKRIAVG